MLALDNLIWIIPGDDSDKYSLKDGEIVGRGKTSVSKQHIDVLMDFIDEFKIEHKNQISVMGCAQTLAQQGMITIINIGKIDNKYAASLFLPEQATEKQIETLECLRETFEESFHSVVNFFKPHVYSTNMSLTYKLKNNCFRDLQIEAIISQKENNNGIELLYQEVEFQKENYPRKNL